MCRLVGRSLRDDHPGVSGEQGLEGCQQRLDRLLVGVLGEALEEPGELVMGFKPSLRPDLPESVKCQGLTPL